jgi:hypothetical protein
LCALLLPLAVTAQTDAGTEGVVERAFAFEHQSAAEAVALVYPYLSELGTVELRPGSNALVISDSREVVERVVALLEDFDRPAQSMQLEIQIVSASSGDEVGDSGLSPELEERLSKLLRYRSYRLVASSRVDASEGWDVLSPMGPDYEVDFRLGLVGTDRRVKLHGFRVLRREGDSETKPLIHTNLNLQLDRPMVLGLARTESSERALMVVLHCTRREEPVDE